MSQVVHGGSCEGTCSDARVWCGHQVSMMAHVKTPAVMHVSGVDTR